MPQDKFLIAPIKEGLERSVASWLIPDDAFQSLSNAYVFRGRVKKRYGTSLLTNESNVNPSINSRLRIKIGVTNATGDLNAAGNTITVPGFPYITVGQMFSIGDNIFTVKNIPTPVVAEPMLSNFGATIYTFNSNTGDVHITGALDSVGAFLANTDVYFYPCLPVMGLSTLEQEDINDETTIAFDTIFPYKFTGSGWDLLGPVSPAAGSAVWSGTNSDFFSTCMYNNGYPYVNDVLYATNFNAADRLKYYNQTTDTWATFTPLYQDEEIAGIIDGEIRAALIVIPFQDRLVLLNTIENQTTAPVGTNNCINRCRYSGNGVDPTDPDAFKATADIKGGYLDANIQEAIVGAKLLRGHLIVFFERSTWELVYTHNEARPFIWNQINSELGVESMNSLISFDQILLGIGEVGIHSCNGVGVERIDKKIPDEVFKIRNDNDGVYRVCGIRDFGKEMVYWTFPSESRSADYPYPNRVLVFNYNNGTWAFNDDSITCFGYLQLPLDLTWEKCGDLTWEEADFLWSSSSKQAKYKKVIGGNQEGFTFVVDTEETKSCQSLQITNIANPVASSNIFTFTVMDHNLSTGDFIYLDRVRKLNAFVPNCLEIPDGNYKVYSVVDADNFQLRIDDIDTSHNYLGGGTVSLVHKIDIITKQFNFYIDKGSRFYVPKVDFLVDKTNHGEVLVDYFSSTASNLSMVHDATLSNAIVGNSILSTAVYTGMENNQDRLWHALYFQCEGDNIQLRFTLTDDQMLNTDITSSAFVLHAMLFHSYPTQEI